MVTPYHAVTELDDRPRESWRLFPYASISYMTRPNTILLVLGDFVELFELLPDGVDRATSVLCEQIQRSFRSGAHSHIVFGRNEPGLVHYHQSMEAMLRNPTRRDVEVPVAVNGFARAGAAEG